MSFQKRFSKREMGFQGAAPLTNEEYGKFLFGRRSICGGVVKLHISLKKEGFLQGFFSSRNLPNVQIITCSLIVDMLAGSLSLLAFQRAFAQNHG